jgi:hypothetical protein
VLLGGVPSFQLQDLALPKASQLQVPGTVLRASIFLSGWDVIRLSAALNRSAAHAQQLQQKRTAIK